MKLLLLVFALLLQLVAIATGQNGCCNSFLMDAPSQVALEVSRVLTSRKEPGEFDNVKVKTCDDSPFYVQLWQRVEASGDRPMYRLVWQVLHTPTRIGTDTWQTINLPERYRLEESHRLGLVTLEGERIAVPYDDNPAGSISVSSSSFDEPLRIMNDATFNAYRYRRTFNNHVLFCDGNDCYNGEQFSSGGLRGQKGDKGDRGEQGETGRCTLTDELNSLFCDTPSSLQDQINRIDNAVKGIKESVDGVGTAIGSGALITGICPQNFLQGQYGLGNCYRYMNMTRMSYGEAALTCHDTNKSLPLYIESDFEESFIVSQILQTFQAGETEKTVWTSGLYSNKLQDFVWFDEKLLLRKIITYRNWAPGYPIMTDVDLETCIVLKVYQDKTYHWHNVDCRERYNFICKRAKNCL